MKKQWAVWTGAWEDNDTPEWYTDHDTAFDAWNKLAQTIPDGESAYMQRFDKDGDVDEDYAHELRREGADVLEYYGGERLWA